MFTPITLLNFFLIMNEKIIQEWLDLCPCKDLVVNDDNYFNPRYVSNHLLTENNFNRTKTIQLYYEVDS